MCRTKDGKRIITARCFRYASGRRFYFIKCKDSTHDELVIELTNVSGEISFFVKDSNENEIVSLINPKTDTYKVKLEVGKTYKFQIISSKSCGGYKISI